MQKKQKGLALILLVLVILVCTLIYFTRGKGKIEAKDIETKEDLLRYINQVGVDHVSWSDFDHLPHEAGGSGMYVVTYTLKDGSRLALSGTGEDVPPWFIQLDLVPLEK